MSSSTTYYPQLTSLISPDHLPEELSFLKGSLSDLLGNIFIKDIQFVNSPSGNGKGFVLILKSFIRLEVGIPGTGMSILLNAPSQLDPDPNSTDIPISVEYTMEIYKEVPDFSFTTFASSPQDIFYLLQNIFSLQDTELLNQTLKLFVTDGKVDSNHKCTIWLS